MDTSVWRVLAALPLLCFPLPRAEALTLQVSANTFPSESPEIHLSALVTGEAVTGAQLYFPLFQGYFSSGFLIQSVSGTLLYNGQSYPLGFSAVPLGDGSWLQPAGGGFYSLGYWWVTVSDLGGAILLYDNNFNYFSFNPPLGFAQARVGFSARVVESQAVHDGETMLPMMLGATGLLLIVHAHWRRETPPKPAGRRYDVIIT